MSITILKKPEPILPADDDLSPASLMDEVRGEIAQIGQLETELAVRMQVLQPLIAKIEQRKKNLRETMEGMAGPDETLSIEHAGFQALLSKPVVRRKISNLPGVLALMGNATFLKCATVPLKAIDDYLSPEERAEVLTEEIGDRTFKFTKKPSA